MNSDWLDDEPAKSKSKKKSKTPAHILDEQNDDTLDSMLDSISKSTALGTSLKSKSGRQAPIEMNAGWSNDGGGDDDDDGDYSNVPRPPPISQRTPRRPAEEIVIADIPTIPMDEVDGDDTIDMTPQIAVAPEFFSIHQIASFNEIENEFSRERTSQYIDSKIDIGILYHNLHLQEDLETEEKKPWDWDKLFVEVRNAITNPTIES